MYMHVFLNDTYQTNKGSMRFSTIVSMIRVTFPLPSGGRLHPERPAGRAGARLPVALGAVDTARAATVGEHHQWLGARIWWWYDGQMGYTPEI